MRRLKVWFSDGDVIYTGFHGTKEEAEAYYAVGNDFILRGIEDRFFQVTKLEILKEVTP